ncbi:E3 ubiquitin-ligase RNF213-like, partial [Brachionus plicatilis]
MDSILKLTRGFNEPNSDEILEIADHYKALTKSDPILGGLLLYYFNPNSQILNQLIQNFPFESFVYHLGYKLLTTYHDEFERVLPKNLTTHINWFYGIFQNLTRSQNTFQLNEIRSALLNIIELMINLFSKESDAIVNLIKILIQVNSVSVDFNSYEKKSNMEKIRSILKKWFENEFNQNILINFGIRNVSAEEIEANKVLINIYRNFSDHCQNYEEDKNEVKKKIRYFGMNNQHTILSSLKQIGLVNQILNDLFIEQISKNQLTDTILFVIDFDFAKYLDNEFREICLQAICDSLIEKKSDQSIRTLCESLKDPHNQHYLDFILDNFVKRIWPKSKYDELKFSIQKPYFLTLVTIFVNHSKLQLSNPFNLSHLYERFHNIIISYKKLINQFVDASISLEGIQLIKSDENNIVSRLNDLIIENFGQDFLLNANNRNFFTKISRIRYQEKDLFDIYRKNVTKFNDFCSKFCLFQPKITSLLDKQKHLDQLPESNIFLNSVCSCINIDDLGKNQNFIPSVTYFDGIDTTLMKEIEKILNYGQKQCLLFDSIFDQFSRVLNVQQLDFANSIGQTSELTFKKLFQIITSVDQGSVKLRELDEIFDKVFGNKSDKFCAELEFWIRHFRINNLSLRIKQIKLFVEFKNSYLAAVEMDKIRQQLGLTNQFNELKKILSINEESYEKSVLSDMDSEVENTISILSTVNQTEKLECLNAFTQSFDLVKWLRENTKSLSELKFLVDLASMSGSNNATYDRSLFARALKDSGTAYSTLIYELELDVTFEGFMRQCQQICSHLESDSSIGAKLLEVKDKVDLLDEIKRTTGNVELNAIHEARLINEKGVYKVGLAQRQIKSNFLANFDKKLDLNEIISLQRDGQAFSYSHLKNLQDILMLIVPKNSQLNNQNEKSTLDYFIQFLSALNRVGQSYINLWEYSCRFFEIFQIKIYANWSKIANLPSVEINSSSGNLSFTHPELNSLHTVTILCNLIDKTEQEWSSFVAKKRDAHPLLNNFSLKQINFLIKSFELVSIQNLSLRQSDFELVQSLLWNINQNLSAQKILQAYSDTLNQMSELESVEMNEYSGLELLFEQQWRAFLAEQNSVNPQSITLTQFASMLACLHEPGRQISRTLPGYLTNTNGPNLISCANSELISVILSIYALTPDQPMPTDSEIVFCQPSTTSEQIENFFRLCFNSHCGMIFTLVNIHNLPYKVSSRAEIFLKNYLQKPQTFNLVLTCDMDKESESILASVYLKNRVRYLLLEPDTLQIYIKRYLTKDQNQLLKLGNFDPDNCSVRVITSDKSGNGKSTYVNHLSQRVKQKCSFNHKIIRIKSNFIDTDREIEKIIEYKKFLDDNNQLDKSTIYHIDIAYEVFNNVEPYLFSLILSSCMAHSNGLVWRRNSAKDFYLIEVTPPKFTNGRCVHSIMDLLPKIVLATPTQYAYQLRNELGTALTIHRPDRLFSAMHQNVEYQRVCFYLKLLNDYRNRTEGLNSNFVSCNLVVEEEADANVKRLFNRQTDSSFSELDCLEILLRIFESVEPNWLEIRNYVEFLNSQLILYENSKILDQVKGFRALCLGLMAVVASNFGLPSLQSVQLDGTNIQLDSYKVDESKKWENLNHPYMILDSTSEKVTFIGVHLDRGTKQFFNSNTLRPLTNLTNCFIPAISQGMLIEFLKLRLRLFNNFNEDHRITKTDILSNIMNLDRQRLLQEDPDEDY